MDHELTYVLPGTVVINVCYCIKQAMGKISPGNYNASVEVYVSYVI